MMATMRLRVEGMHCPACSALVRREFSSVPGTLSVSVDLAAGEAEVVRSEGSPEDARPAYAEIAAKFGYRVVPEDGAPAESGGASVSSARPIAAAVRDWILGAAIAAAGILGISMLMKVLPGPDLTAAGAGIGVAFLTGIAASLSSCLAMVGTIIIGISATAAAKRPGMASVAQANLAFQAGRIGGFALLGAVLGLIGGRLVLTGTAIGTMTLFASLVMAFIGLRILGFLPSFAEMRARIFGSGSSRPGGAERAIDALALKGNSVARALVGALTFFLPCGFTQGMQALALASGNPATGAALLGVFALGTAPVLFAAGFASGATTGGKYMFLKKAVGIIVVGFAVITAANAVPLLSFGNERLYEGPAASPPPAASEYFEASMSVTAKGFEPAVIRVPKGAKVRWTVKGVAVSGCTNAVIIPALKLRFRVSQGKDSVVEFDPGNRKELPFSCWMGMVRGKFVFE